MEPVDAVILRVPSWVGSYLASVLLPIGHPYGVEVVGDPYDLFAPGAVRHPLRPFLRWSSPRTLRWTCSGASAAAYVAEETLQRRYPCLGYCTSYSSVEISDADLVMAPRSLRPDGRALILVTVGSLAQPYKGVDVLISAVGGCVREGLNLRLVVVGDGRYRQELEARAAALGLGDCVRFTGQLTSREAVRAELDVADLFALASLTEGLPRAMIEAMARGLPCIGTTVGGIPELLPPDAMVPPGDAAALAELIRAVVMDPIRMATMSARNLAKARKYHKDILQARRRAFYRQVHERTAQWLKSQATDLLLQPARDA